MPEASWLLFVVASLVVITTPPLGLGAILLASDWLFLALKLIGAAYLIYLGVALLRTKSADLAFAGMKRRSLGKLFFEGAMSNLSNAKIVIFYLAFLPQFVPPSAQHPTLTVFSLGVAFAALTFLVKGPVGVFAGTLSGWLRRRPAALTWIYRSSGAILIGLGVRLAFERR
jgi:threonine/homoserine/homoserine lactone efflux protein